MKLLVFTILVFFSKIALSFDHSVAIDQKNHSSADYFYFLNINSDYSGVLIRYYGDKPTVRKFDSNSVIKRGGYFEVQLNQREKAIFSAWKLKSGSGKLTGQVFMYKEDGKLFNMLYFPLQLLKEGHELLEHEAIKELSATYR